MSSFIPAIGISLTSLEEDIRILQHARRKASGKAALGKDTTAERAGIAEQEQWLRGRVREHEDEIRAYTKEARETLMAEDHIFLEGAESRLRKIKQSAKPAWGRA